METVREQICRREREYLCPEACLSENTKGRARPLSEETLRTEFQRDRDRIIHCKSFRRLMHKTQVFLCPEDDHYRTRLTHTLEVAQIARTIARSLFVNEDLAEAIALGHDLGHTPFGHAGERMLNQLLPGGFRHGEQSLRVVDVLENLNLTYEVRDGILKHTNGIADTVEGQIVRISDRIAYINHDIDDALRGNVISDDSIPLMLQNVLGYDHGERIDTMVTNVVRHGIVNGRVGMDGDVGSATEELHELLFKIVYTNPKAKGEEGRAEEMVGRLYEFYRNHPEKIPPLYAKNLENDGVERCTADFISGMTDRYAISNFKQLFIPKVWQGPVD